MQSAKRFSNKILQFLTGLAAIA